MVAATMPQFSSATTASRLFRFQDKPSPPPPPTTLGIIAFDVAKTMSRLISLYKSLSDDEVDNLRKGIIRSEGVAFLNSRDEAYLLNLACAERLEALDTVAATISNLGRKCSDLGLNRFDLVYADLKLGLIDIGRLEFASRNADRIVEKMEKLTSATVSLYSALETLAEMETSERKLGQWKRNAETASTGPSSSNYNHQLALQKANFDLFESKIIFQRKQVRHYKDASLWSQTIDKCVGLMARIVCVVFMRICVVFGSYIADLPTVRPHKQSLMMIRQMMRVHPDNMTTFEKQAVTNSGPISSTGAENRSGLAKFYSRKLKMNLFVPEDMCLISGLGNRDGKTRDRRTTVFHSAPETTVGGSGLALLYANVILMAEKFLSMPTSIGEDARSFMYEMLPTKLRMKVRSKLRRSSIMNHDDYLDEDSDDEEQEGGSGSGSGREQAEGWRDALEAIMEWLAPVAHDTVRWQSERNLEKQRFDSKPTALLIQTLHYSDMEKTEAAIVEVLVGLSFIFKYENRRSCFGGKIH